MGKLELGACWPAGLGCNQRQTGNCGPCSSVFSFFYSEGGRLSSTIPSSPPSQAVISVPAGLWDTLPQTQAESQGVPCPQLPVLTSPLLLPS